MPTTRKKKDEKAPEPEVEAQEPAPKAPKKAPDVTGKILDLESDIDSAIGGVPDIVKAAYSQVLSAIGTLKDSIKTEEALRRPPPRTTGGRSEDGSST